MSLGMHYRISHSSHFITNVLSDARRGELVLPQFQRPFCWDPADVLALLDSALRGFPLGTLLLWGDWWGGGISVANCRSFLGCAPPQKSATLVLDGQQRIQALLLASASDSPYIWNADTGEFAQGQPDPPSGVFPAAWLFDFPHGKEQTAAWALGEPAIKEVVEVARQVPYGKQGKTRTLVEKKPIYHERTPAQELAHQRFEALCTACTAMRDLRLGSVILPRDAGIDFARETFRRMNTAGKPFTEADVFAALGAP